MIAGGFTRSEQADLERDRDQDWREQRNPGTGVRQGVDEDESPADAARRRVAFCCEAGTQF
jgi:hypothetical protein